MKPAIFGLVLIATFSAPAPASAQQPLMASAGFIDDQGLEIGGATLTETQAGVLIAMTLRSLPPGERAFHIHARGVCNPADKFASAGPHFDVHSKKHGYMAEGGPHAGDMPNQVVGLDGVLRANVLNPNVTLKDGPGSLFGPEGTSLVIHLNPDDYTSQPAGNAGDRIACAVIRR